MATAAILKFYFNGHNSATIADIRTTFDTEAENEVPDVVLPTKCTCDKIQDGGDSQSRVRRHVRRKIRSSYCNIHTLRHRYLDQAVKQATRDYKFFSKTANITFKNCKQFI